MNIAEVLETGGFKMEQIASQDKRARSVGLSMSH